MPDRGLDERLNQAIEAVLARAPVEAHDPKLDALVQTASALREMPAYDFQSRLRTELQRRANMSRTAVHIREGFRTVTPCITVPERDQLIAFLKRTFGAEELLRTEAPGGVHTEIRIGDSVLVIGWGESVSDRKRIGAFHVYLPDCDAAYQRAMEAGATSMGAPSDRPHGERSAFVKDFAGNHWYISTRFDSTAAPAGMGTVVPYLLPPRARAFIGFVKRAFEAEELGVYEEGGRVMHATVRIGDAIVEMGEPREPESMRSKFFLYVEDCDAWYQRAMEAGAVSVEEPTDKPYGHRTATIVDPFGYEWIPASLLDTGAS